MIKVRAICKCCQYKTRFRYVGETWFSKCCPVETCSKSHLLRLQLPTTCPYELEAFMYCEGRLRNRVWSNIKRLIQCFVNKFVNNASIIIEQEDGIGQE